MGSACYDMALFYLSRGFSVIPVTGKHLSKDPDGCKKPLVPWQEYQNRLPTEKEVTEWYNKYPQAGVAIITGRISNIVVVDFDSDEAIEFGKAQKLFNTPVVKTARGVHAYYQYPGENRVPNTVNFRGLKIDIRGDGGYVVAPPTEHFSGHKYTWVDNYDLNTKPLAPLPSIFLQDNFSDSRDLRQLYGGVPQGNRNVSLARLVGSWVNDKLSFEECLELATVWNQKNNPPLPEAEVYATVKSIFQRHYLHQQFEKPPSTTQEKIVLSDVCDLYLKTTPAPITYTTGIDVLDKHLHGGFKAESLVVLGGLPKTGKTAFLVQLALATAKNKNPVIFYTCEMSAATFFEKLLANWFWIRLSEIQFSPQAHLESLKRQIDKDKEFKPATEKIIYAPLPLSEKEIRTDIDQYQPKIIVIDSFQPLRFLKTKYWPDPYQVTVYHINMLKRIAIEYGIVVIVVSNIDRQRINKTIDISAFVHSSIIEYAADVVLALASATTKNKIWEEILDKNPQEADPLQAWVPVLLKILKTRYGEETLIPLKFYKHHQRFVSQKAKRSDKPSRQQSENMKRSS